MLRWISLSVVAVLLLARGSEAATATEPLFESAHVHPLALTPDGSRLLAVNTGEHRLMVFDLSAPQSPVLSMEIPVGAEPVSVRPRNNREAWVVNHLSDSITLVDVQDGRVLRTLAVGDEPTDVIFAGTPPRAFVCLSQEDRVLVLDPDVLGEGVSIQLEGNDPRSLAVSPDGQSVYVTLLESGNRTTVVAPDIVGSSLGWPAPDPPMNPLLPPAPATSLILQWADGYWQDELARNWSEQIPYQVLDQDVAVIDANRLFVKTHHSDIGSSVFNVAVHPTTGEIFATAIHAHNQVRFEPNLRGRFADNVLGRVVPATGTVTTVDLNPHIDGNDPAGNSLERERSLALPTDVTVADDRVWITATGSDVLAVLSLEGVVLDRLPTGPGPTGVAINPSATFAYVLNRFAPSLTVWSLTDRSRTDIPLPSLALSPELAEGRRLFYRAREASAHGDLSCATCHIFAGTDRLAWDLGNPEGNLTQVPGTPLGASHFHPMKGPMVTQSLKGLAGTEPFHWRGDRANLSRFNPAFVTLLGREAQLTSSQLAAFEAFIMALAFPPNPFLNVDESFLPSAGAGDPAHGEELFLAGALMDGLNCQDCHGFPTGESSVIVAGPMLLDSQDLNVPQLRDLYEKTGFDRTQPVVRRGFGFNHDGGTDNLLSLLRDPTFTFASDADRKDLVAYLRAFASETHPAVGSVWELDTSEPPAAVFAAAAAGRLGLYAKGTDGSGGERGWMWENGGWRSDRVAEPTLTLSGLRAVSEGIRVTAVSPGSERRLGVDRDQDGYLDRDEWDAGSDPADATSVPGDHPVSQVALLFPPRPNPVVGSSTLLSYVVPVAGRVQLTLYNLNGEPVQTLLHEPNHASGDHDVLLTMEGSRGPLARGIYFIHLITPAGSVTQKLTVLRP